MAEKIIIEESFCPTPISSAENYLKVVIVVRLIFRELSKAYRINGLKNTLFFILSILLLHLFEIFILRFKQTTNTIVRVIMKIVKVIATNVNPRS